MKELGEQEFSGWIAALPQFCYLAKGMEQEAFRVFLAQKKERSEEEAIRYREVFSKLQGCEGCTGCSYRKLSNSGKS